MIIACVSDSEYFKFLKPLVNSITKNSSNCSIYCKLINCSELHETELKDINPNTECSHDYCELSKSRTMLSKDGILVHEYLSTGLEKPILKGGSKWLTSPFMGFCTNIRFKVISELLNRDEPVFFLDADCIVRRDISAYRIDDDVSVRIGNIDYDGHATPKRPISDPGSIQYQLGAIYVNPTESSKQFFRACHEICCEDMSDWDQDIIAFKQAMKIHDITIIPLPTTFKDEGTNVKDTKHSGYVFDLDSHIWTGPGRRKFVNKQYVDEYLKYV